MTPHPLDNRRERNLAPLLFAGLAATAVLIAGAWAVDKRTESRRIANIERALAARNIGAVLEVRPVKGDDCWRAAEGFAWKTEDAAGYACAGPGSKVDLDAVGRLTTTR